LTVAALRCRHKLWDGLIGLKRCQLRIVRKNYENYM